MDFSRYCDLFCGDHFSQASSRNPSFCQWMMGLSEPRERLTGMKQRRHWEKRLYRTRTGGRLIGRHLKIVDMTYWHKGLVRNVTYIFFYKKDDNFSRHFSERQTKYNIHNSAGKNIPCWHESHVTYHVGIPPTKSQYWPIKTSTIRILSCVVINSYNVYFITYVLEKKRRGQILNPREQIWKSWLASD